MPAARPRTTPRRLPSGDQDRSRNGSAASATVVTVRLLITATRRECTPGSFGDLPGVELANAKRDPSRDQAGRVARRCSSTDGSSPSAGSPESGTCHQSPPGLPTQMPSVGRAAVPPSTQTRCVPPGDQSKRRASAACGRCSD